MIWTLVLGWLKNYLPYVKYILIGLVATVVLAGGYWALHTYIKAVSDAAVLAAKNHQLEQNVIDSQNELNSYIEVNKLEKLAEQKLKDDNIKISKELSDAKNGLKGLLNGPIAPVLRKAIDTDIQ